MRTVIWFSISVGVILSNVSLGADYVCTTSEDGNLVATMTITPSELSERLMDLSNRQAFLYARCRGEARDTGTTLLCSLENDLMGKTLSFGEIKDGAKSIVLSSNHGKEDQELVCSRK